MSRSIQHLHRRDTELSPAPGRASHAAVPHLAQIGEVPRATASAPHPNHVWGLRTAVLLSLVTGGSLSFGIAVSRLEHAAPIAAAVEGALGLSLGRVSREKRRRERGAFPDASAAAVASARETPSPRQATPPDDPDGELARLATIVEESPSPIVVLTADGRVRHVNPAAQLRLPDIAMLGSEHEALRGVLELAAGARAAGESGVTREVAVAGRRFMQQISVTSADGTIGIYCVDVTERRRAEEALAASQEQLRSSQKLEAIGRLAGGIAHDFNNLLTVINGYSELLLMRLPEGSPLAPELGEIKRSGERAATLTHQLLAFSRRQVLQPRVLDLNHAVTELERMLRRLIGEDIDLETRLAPDLGLTRADPAQLEQVLLNLVVNAADSMPNGGRLTVETINVERDAARLDEADRGSCSDCVMLVVSDEGCGMDPETRERIFEPFFTTKTGKGTGLGLATVYGIVKQSGGSIEVESAPGKGSTFRVFLPRVVDEPASPPDEATPAPARRGGDETVLVVEDDPALRGLVREVLESAGYRVLEAADGEAAIAAAARFRDPIHLAITDLVMPRMGGTELAARLSRARPDLRLLYTSGYAERAAVHAGSVREGAHYLAKPFTPALLLERVREALGTPSTVGS